MKAFFDTNVLMDVFGKREPFYVEAVAAWNLVDDGRARGYVSAIRFTNVFYVVRKLVDVKAARLALRILRDGFEIVTCDRNIVSLAMDSDLRDFEDAIQYFSALDIAADFLVTRNARDFPSTGKLAVVTPEEFAHALGDGRDESRS